MTTKLKPAAFKFKPFSKKQKQVLSWWIPGVSPHADKDAIICDGSVRAGKTVVMSLSYVMWAMDQFQDENFGMAGKTIGSFRRNVLTPLKRMLKSRGYSVKDHRADNYLTISYNGKTNSFYFFGGKDERSQDLIQGITLAGMFFDEVALMPQSFVNQATARCSVTGAKFWFNCNPAGPYHWFKTEWLDQCENKYALHLHFTMDDNLSLPERVQERYRRMYSGVFFRRYILGEWCLAEGLIYDSFDDKENTFDDEDLVPGFKYLATKSISLDYGTQNAFAALEIWDDGDTLFVMREYYYSGRDKGVQKDDAAYADDMVEFIGEDHPRFIIIDPSAASFKVAMRNRGYRVKDANNDVLEGIKAVSTMFAKRKIRIHRRNCPATIREVQSYVWNEKSVEKGKDEPLKINDHSADALRYYVHTVVKHRRIHTRIN